MSQQRCIVQITARVEWSIFFRSQSSRNAADIDYYVHLVVRDKIWSQVLILHIDNLGVWILRENWTTSSGVGYIAIFAWQHMQIIFNEQASFSCYFRVTMILNLLLLIKLFMLPDINA